MAEAQADYVATGLGVEEGEIATVEQVALLRRHIAPIKVKAAGGIRDVRAVLALISAGAERVAIANPVEVLRA